MRSVPPWIGKTADTPVPPRVRLRLFEAYGGKCSCCGRKIMPGESWQLDHYVALANGGAHCELNLKPILTEHHKIKTRTDVAEKVKTYRVRSRAVGLKRQSSRPMPGSRASAWKHTMAGQWIRRTIEAEDS